MKVLALAVFMLALGVDVLADTPPDFSGTWALDASRSKNLGMMANMDYKSVISQTDKVLAVRDLTGMQGETRAQETKYDLTGASTPNLSFLGDQAQTVSHWSGVRLVTTWTSAGAIAGSTSVRTETRALSQDGKTMTIESTNGNKPSIVFVFDRK